MIKAIIFDFDGTIVDTESPWFDLVTELYQRYEQGLPLQDYLKCIGTHDTAFNVFNHLESLLGRPIDQVAIKQELSGRHAELMKVTQLRPGVLTTIQAARASGLPLAIASSSPLRWVSAFLQQFNLEQYFERVVTADEVEKVKPDPALFNLAGAALGARPPETLVFEDSCYGLQAAQAAGQPCVVVHNRITVAMAFPGAARVYADFTEFQLEDVLSL